MRDLHGAYLAATSGLAIPKLTDSPNALSITSIYAALAARAIGAPDAKQLAERALETRHPAAALATKVRAVRVGRKREEELYI